jgi:hypothetical protein
MTTVSTCQMCEREVDELTKHHLIPRTRHKNKKNKRDFSREEVHERVIWICRPCHKNIHALITEKEMERTYNTLESLLSHMEVKRFVEWIKDKPHNISLRTKKAKR